VKTIAGTGMIYTLKREQIEDLEQIFAKPCGVDTDGSLKYEIPEWLLTLRKGTDMKIKFAENLEEVQCLMWYDGPMMSVYRDTPTNRLFLIIWCDILDDGTWVSHAIEMSQETHDLHMTNQITSRQVMERSPTIWLCESFDLGIGEHVLYSQIPEDRRPTEDSFLGPYGTTTGPVAVSPASPGVYGGGIAGTA